jgi:D-beta-D-heptose 7-phosphate kinase/D-beta-D-heptose 1-phosphate adenosyltransferase
MKDTAEIIALVNAFTDKKILVIGDLLVDIYLKGVSTRLCSETQVPVVNIQERTILPGGAARTVSNLKALGASVIFCTGDCEYGSAGP